MLTGKFIQSNIALVKIAISGSTGLVGETLVNSFKAQRHSVARLVRPCSKKENPEENIFWDAASKTIDLEKLEDYDVVIHLAGANIAQKRWSESYKEEILKTRVEGTQFLVESLLKLKQPPKVFFCASAVGFYGNRPSPELVDESTLPGKGFLADVCQKWERTAAVAQQKGIRVVSMRLGAVLTPRGGVLAKLLPVFKLGLGGKLGKGNQIFSWIAVDEIPLIISYLLQKESLSGPINFVSPQIISNVELTKVLGKVLKRPTIFSVPAFGVKLLFGEMGQELLLSGAPVVPKKLSESGYTFQYTDLETTLKKYI